MPVQCLDFAAEGHCSLLRALNAYPKTETPGPRYSAGSRGSVSMSACAEVLMDVTAQSKVTRMYAVGNC